MVDWPAVTTPGIGAIIAIVLGIVALSRAKREPQRHGGQGMAIGGIVSGGLALIVFQRSLAAALAAGAACASPATTSSFESTR